MSIHSTSATDRRTHDVPGVLPEFPGELPGETAPPQPRTAILLGLAFGASAGLMTVLYLMFV